MSITQEDPDSEGLAQERVLTKLNPYSYTEYSWDSPAATGKKIRLVADSQERLIDIMEIGSLQPWKFMGSVSDVPDPTTGQFLLKLVTLDSNRDEAEVERLKRFRWMFVLRDSPKCW